MTISRIRALASALALTLAAPVLATAPAAAQETPTCDGIPATIVGTNGDDLLVGTSGRDVIVALDGNDVIRAGAGGDIICAGAGRDRVLGGKGADRIFGGDDGDKLFGDSGADEIHGDRGNDLLVGGQGDDVLDGGRGRRDRLRGRAGTAICTDPQAGTSMDAVCNAALTPKPEPQPTPPASPLITSFCGVDDDGFTTTTTRGTWTNTTGATVGAVFIEVDLVDADGIRFGDALGMIENIRPGETVHWDATTFDDDANRTATCRVTADIATIFDADDEGALWNVTNLQCGPNDFGMEATGRATNPTATEVDVFVKVYVTGADGIRLDEELIDLVEDILPGETFEFDASGFDDLPAGGIASCHVFIDVSTIDF